jgi:hypothetical protein
MTDDPQANSLADILDGKGVPFVVDGATFLIRPPTTEEYDDAIAMERLMQKRWLSDPALASLKDEPCSDEERRTYQVMIDAAERQFTEAADGSQEKQNLAERLASLQRTIEKRTLAEELAGDRALLARDRYLTQRLLCDEHGKQILNPRAADFPEQWEGLPLKVKNAARPAIWTALGQVRQAPFSWEKLRGRKPA